MNAMKSTASENFARERSKDGSCVAAAVDFLEEEDVAGVEEDLVGIALDSGISGAVIGEGRSG